MLKFYQTAEIFFSMLISFIETPGPPLLGCLWHICPAVTRCRHSLIPSPQENMHVSLPQQLITQKLLRGIRGCGGRQGGGQTGTGASLFFLLPPFIQTIFCSVNPQVHWPCLVDWVTAGLYFQKISMCQTFQSLLGKWHKLMTSCWTLFW